MGKDEINKFNGEGFHTWQVKLRGYLMKKNLWAITKTSPQEGTQTRASASSTQTTFQDEQALGIIITALHDNYVHFVDECDTAHNAWITLEKNFGARVKKSKVSLKRQLYKLKLEDNEDVASVVNRLKSIITQLTYIQCGIEEEDKVAALLGALPETFDNIVTIIEEKEPAPALQDVINSLQTEEKKHKKDSTLRGGVFVAQSSITCYTCNRTGHVSKDCYQNIPCHHCKKTGHPPERCYFKDKDKKTDKASSSSSKQQQRNKGKINLVEDKENSEDEDAINMVEFNDSDEDEIL